jgi:hypothetical protein
MKSVAVSGPSQLCHSGNLQVTTTPLNAKVQPLQSVLGVFTSPSPGESDVRSGGSVQLGACVGAVCRGAACGRARFDAVYEKERMHPLDIVRVELCKDAGRVESCF